MGALGRGRINEGRRDGDRMHREPTVAAEQE